jgi:secondary thiamine-phosphate synthase enzyme
MTAGAVETIAQGVLTRQITGRLTVQTRGQGFTEITEPVRRWVADTGLSQGLLTTFCRHTSASLTIQENADPDVRTDLLTALDRLAPRHAAYVHTLEGPDDMPGHIRTMLTDVAVAIPVVDGGPMLGTWQGLYLVEHRDRPHRREVILHLIGG